MMGLKGLFLNTFHHISSLHSETFPALGLLRSAYCKFAREDAPSRVRAPAYLRMTGVAVFVDNDHNRGE